MIRSTLQAQPRRLTVLIAKIGVFAALMLVVGELLSFAAFFVGRPIIASHIPVALGPGRHAGRARCRALSGPARPLRAGLRRHPPAHRGRDHRGARHRPHPVQPDRSPARQLGTATSNAWMPTNAGQLIMQARPAPDDLLSAWQGLAVFAGGRRFC